MQAAGAARAAGGWLDLAARAASAADRPEAVRQAARTFEPELGDLDAFERARLLSSVEEIVAQDGAYVVPIHTSQPYWVPSMLDDGFRWERPRMEVDGAPFEPYEDKLREYHGLGPGERSEDFLFAETRLVPRTGTLEDSLEADAARMRATFGVGSRTAPNFGTVTLAFDPDTLIGSTLLPATRLLGQYGTSVGTIEHLPGIIASRIAIEGGARAEVERYGLQMHDIPASSIERVLGIRAGYRRQLVTALEAGHDERVRAVRGIMRNIFDNTRSPREHEILKLNPVEAHVRGLTPQHVRFIDIEDGFFARGAIAPRRLDLIDAAATRRGIPVVGMDQHRESFAKGLERNPDYASTFRDEPTRPTAVATTDLRQRMARRRSEHAAPGAES